MPKYKVVRPIEYHNKLYFPAGATSAGTAKSAAHGGDIPVDNSGTIELTVHEAATFTHGELAPLANGSSVTTQPGKTEKPPLDFMPTPVKQ